MLPTVRIMLLTKDYYNKSRYLLEANEACNSGEVMSRIEAKENQSKSKGEKLRGNM
jgi:hypothetical protein